MKYKVNEDVLWKIVDDEVVIVDTDSDQYYYLNKTGTDVWRLLTEEKDMETILKTLQSNYDIDEAQLKEDVDEILGDLKEKKFIV